MRSSSNKCQGVNNWLNNWLNDTILFWGSKTWIIGESKSVCESFHMFKDWIFIFYSIVWDVTERIFKEDFAANFWI